MRLNKLMGATDENLDARTPPPEKADEGKDKAPDKTPPPPEVQNALHGVDRVRTERVVLAEDASKSQTESTSTAPKENDTSNTKPSETPPAAPAETQTPPDTSTWGELKDYFSKMEASGAPWYSALASTLGYGAEMLWDKVTSWFGGKKEEEKKKDTTGPQSSIEPVSGSALPQDLERAKALLKTVMEDSEKKQWVAWAKAIETSDNPKYGRVPASTILAFINTESKFNAQAGSPTGALGLGQFVPGTWQQFQSENPEFAGVEATDPHASLCAIAWYCKSNAAELGVDATDPKEAGLLYMAHFAGSGGFAHIQDSLAGKPVDLPPPGAYGDPKQPAFYCKDYAAYAQLGKRLGAQVQAVADSYAEMLKPSSQPNS